MSAPSAPESSVPLSFDRVLEDERRVLDKAGGQPLSALCLSGGGVRSASFCLGVLQAFSRAGVLDRFDYLSTVSGGGYIGGWLSAWRCRAKRAGHPDPCGSLDAAVSTADEPHSLGRLRAYIKYLTPHTGILSADVWTLIGTMLRNLLVNWMLLIPIIAAAAMAPRLYLGLLGLPTQPELVSPETIAAWYRGDWVLIAVLVAIAATYAALQLPSLGRRPYGLRGFLGWFLIPVLALHVVFSVHRFWAPMFGDEVPLAPQLLISSVGMMLPWLVAGALGGRFWQPAIWIAAAVSGAAGRLAAWRIHEIATSLAHHDPQAFVVLDLTASLFMFFVQIALFIAFASRAMTDEDREWWARTGAWILISGITWGVVSAVVIAGPLALNAAVESLGLSHTHGRVGLAILTVAAGIAHRTSAAWSVVSASSTRLRPVIASLTAPLITLSLFVLTSDMNGALLAAVHARHLFAEHEHFVGASLPEDLVGLALLVILGLVLGRAIAVNRFSLHGMYRSRLVRTFLGASRPAGERQPSPFTGFDPRDDLQLVDLAGIGRPFHVVNATLNTVDDHSLGTAEQKARSFTFSALHSGSAGLGYRPSSEYAGGVTLGDALTTSGAAVNSNMGAEATRTQTFLLTLFNARLGAWLGNPGPQGRSTWMKPLPSFGIGPLLNELIARTTDRNPYINLSDGGHFDNLGLYEMVRRRCQTIVAIDAGADPAYAFSDLANAIRLARVDFGVSITFPDGLPIGLPEPGVKRSRWAVGTIDYQAADPDARNGVLIYIKPAILGDEPIDVANYARTHPPFPHQATTNQWFDNAEFESYRALGWHTVTTLCGDRKFAHPHELVSAAAPTGV